MKRTTSNGSEVVLSAVRKYKAFIAPTYGPAGKGTLIGGDNAKIVDDGQMSSREFELEDELENAVISYMKQSSETTNSKVGDGTTTAGLISSEVVEEALGTDEYTITTKNVPQVIRELRKALPEAVSQIKKTAKKIKTKEELRAIAFNSFNNETIADLVAEVVHKVGVDGVVSLQESQTHEHSYEIVNGLEVDKGYFSPYLLRDGNEIRIENPGILLVNYKIEGFAKFTELIKPFIESGDKNLVVMAHGFSDQVLTGTILNMARGVFNILLVESPGYGDRKTVLLKDIEALTGAKMADEKTEDLPVLGRAQVVVSKQDKTTIIGAEGKPKEYIKTIEEKLKDAVGYEKEVLTKRIASLKGGVAVIKVGGHTEGDRQYLRAKVDDAVHATQAAFRSGVVAGGGMAIANVKTSSEVLNKILQAPRKQLEENGKEFLDKDVYDPTEVVTTAVECGVSVGIALINVGSITAPKIEKKDE